MTSEDRTTRQLSTRKPNLFDIQVAGHEVLRTVNRRILLNIVSDRQPISRADIAKLSGLNKATVSMITNELLRDKFVIEDGMGKTTPIGGKPPTPLRINEMRFGLFGIDIRADETILALCDFQSRLVARKSYETGSDPKAFLREIADEISKLRAEHSQFIEIAGIGVSLPGLVDNRSGRFITSVVLPWREVPVVELLGKSTGLRVTIDNSARCAALAEIWHGKSNYAHIRDLLYVSVSSGLACGVVIDGALYRGGTNTAGQFGHLSIESNGPECRCGQRGCWDLYASDNATVARYKGLANATLKRGVSIRRIVELVESGDPAAIEAVSESARYLGRGIAGLINGFDPEVVVVGGEITKAWGLVEPIISQELQHILQRPEGRSVALRRSTFDVRPSLKGALTLVLSDLLSVPHLG
jgi:predicted NBD/HSP70 family sugar kinase